ncbi:MAG: hypothetical protein ACK2T6_05810 [Anaerolineae bacterium]
MGDGGFQQFLADNEVPRDQAERAVDLAAEFARFLSDERGKPDATSADREDVDAFSRILIESNRNTRDTYVALIRYAAFVDNREAYVTAVAYLDGYEALGNLHEKLGDRLGDAARDSLFDGADVPPLGLPGRDKARAMSAVVERLEHLDPEACREVLASGLRDMPDEWYDGEREKYMECGSVDRYLERRREEFVSGLHEHRDSGKWWWGQEVTDEMLDYVQANPEVGGGVREGRIVYESKIPYMAHEHVTAGDEESRRYYFCHCPWARESLRDEALDVPPAFCNCSAAFHKRPWEAVFGRPLRAEVLESVLAGDDRCRFAIYLPEDAVLAAPDRGGPA